MAGSLHPTSAVASTRFFRAVKGYLALVKMVEANAVEKLVGSLARRCDVLR